MIEIFIDLLMIKHLIIAYHPPVQYNFDLEPNKPTLDFS